MVPFSIIIVVSFSVIIYTVSWSVMFGSANGTSTEKSSTKYAIMTIYCCIIFLNFKYLEIQKGTIVPTMDSISSSLELNKTVLESQASGLASFLFYVHLYP